jgi:hypothetical protein
LIRTFNDRKRIAAALLLATTMIVLSQATMAGAVESPALDLELSPPIITADGEIHEIVVVQLETYNGYPYLAQQDVTVYLASSNLDVGLVDESVVVPAGRSYAKAAFNASYNSGMSMITATAAGFTNDEAIIQAVRSDFDAQLRVYAVPDVMPAVENVEGRAVVQILDLEGAPYNTLQDVNVVLSSSNETILTLQETVTIGKGTNYVEVPFTVNSEKPGEVTVFAHASNFEPGSDVVATMNETGAPDGLRLYFGPSILLPDQGSHAAVTIQLMDSEGRPAEAETSTTVTMSSSNLNIATVERTLTIPRGDYHATTSVRTRYVNGETTVSASSPSLDPQLGTLTVRGAVPKILEIYTVPNTVVADGSSNEIITIQVQDEEGYPIKTGRDIPLYLSSSATVGEVPVSATIPKGQSYTSVAFTSTTRVGKATIAVATQGLEPSETTVKTMRLEMNVTMTTPRTIMLNQTFTAQVNVTSYGYPVQGAEIRWSALGGVLKSEEVETDENGTATAEIVQTYEQLNLKAQASKPGYSRQTAQKNIKITVQTERRELTVSILGFEVTLFVLLIIGALIIAVGLGAYVYLKHRKNKRDKIGDLELFT